MSKAACGDAGIQGIGEAWADDTFAHCALDRS